MNESDDLSPHALRRGAQRRVSADEIELAKAWGKPIRQRDGRVAFHLGRREAASATAMGATIPERALGVAVVVAEDGCVVTVSRSPDRQRLRTHGRGQRPSGRRWGQR